MGEGHGGAALTTVPPCLPVAAELILFGDLSNLHISWSLHCSQFQETLAGCSRSVD